MALILIRGFTYLVVFLSLADAEIRIPLEIADGGYLYVHARIADTVDAKLMLDTGAGINTISDNLFGRLQSLLTPGGTHTGTRHNGEVLTGPVWSLPSLALGDFRKSDVIVGRFAPQGADGLLSMDFFRDQPVTLDLAAGNLIIETQAHLQEIASKATPIPIRVKTDGPELEFFVRVCAGAKAEAEAEFDTGAGFNMLMLKPSYMAPLGLRPDGAPRGPLEYYVYSTFLPELHYCAAPSLSSTHQFVGFKDGLIYDALVGHGIFRGRQLTIDIPGLRLLVW